MRIVWLAAPIAALLVSCSDAVVKPVTLPPVVLTLEREPVRPLPTHPSLQVIVRGPRVAPYRPDLVGSKPERVDIAVVDVTEHSADISGVRIAFRPRRNGVAVRCPALDDVPLREPHWIRPGETVVFERELCSLPLPGAYAVDVLLGFGPEEPLKVAGRFDVDVIVKGVRPPHPVHSRPGLYAAMGADTSGVRFTAVEWKSGTYHVVMRLTNASTESVPVGSAGVTFRVTRDRQPLACTSTHEVVLPSALASGEDVVTQVPVTCLIDVKGRYEIDATLALAGDGDETPLGAFGVEVTTDPLLYLPTWPIEPW